MNDTHPSAKSVIVWRTTMVLNIALLMLLTLDHAFIRPVFYVVVWLIQTVPLLLVLPGLLQRNARSCIWLCFMILFHLLAAISNVAISGHPAFYSCMAALILLLFTSALLFVRWQNH